MRLFNKFSVNKQLLLLQHLSKNVMRINMMRITCPNCHTAYDVPDHLLAAASRPLRCSVCGNSWVYTKPAPIMAMPDPVIVPDEPVMVPDEPVIVPDEPAAAEAPPTPVVDAAERPRELSASPKVPSTEAPSHAEWNGSSSALPLIILIIIGVLLALLGVAVLERTEIMHLLPASTALFRALGLA